VSNCVFSPSYYYREFVDITSETLTRAVKLKWQNEDSFKKLLREEYVRKRTLLVPKLEEVDELRIKVVTKKEWDFLCRKGGINDRAESKCKLVSYLFGFEPKDLNHSSCKGVMVSCWGNKGKATSQKLGYGFANATICAYRRGYGSRRRSKCWVLSLQPKGGQLSLR